MQVKQYFSIKEYFVENLSFLEQEEAANSLLIGIPLAMMKDKADESFLSLFSVFIKDELVYTCIRTSPSDNFLIYGTQPTDTALLEALIRILLDKNIAAQGVTGAKEAVIAFAEIWKKLSGQDFKFNFHQLIYQLDQVKQGRISAGNFRKAKLADLPVVEQWFLDFSKEVGIPFNSDRTLKLAASKIVSGDVYLFENEKLLTMAAASRPTKNGISINYVYTPPEFRGKGYAYSCVATLSKLMLEQYKFCCLFTDESNPVSNRIYLNIGYYPIAEYRQIRFITENSSNKDQ